MALWVFPPRQMPAIASYPLPQWASQGLWDSRLFFYWKPSSLGYPESRGLGVGGAAEESARHLQSLLGGPYHSRICLPPGSGPDAHMSHAAAATLLRSCYTGCGQHRCRFCRLGGRAHILPSLGHRRSQGHSSSRNCRLHENTEWRHEAQPWLAEPGALRRAKF